MLQNRQLLGLAPATKSEWRPPMKTRILRAACVALLAVTVAGCDSDPAATQAKNVRACIESKRDFGNGVSHYDCSTYDALAGTLAHIRKENPGKRVSFQIMRGVEMYVTID